MSRIGHAATIRISYECLYCSTLTSLHIMVRHCNHSVECCNNHEHACKTVARPTYHRRVHSATAIWHSNRHDCKYCNTTQYADDKQWLATIRATAKATTAQWRVDHPRHDTTTNAAAAAAAATATATATAAAAHDSIPPANATVPAAVLTPPPSRIATAVAHQSAATYSRPLTRSNSTATVTASAVDRQQYTQSRRCGASLNCTRRSSSTRG